MQALSENTMRMLVCTQLSAKESQAAHSVIPQTRARVFLLGVLHGSGLWTFSLSFARLDGGVMPYLNPIENHDPVEINLANVVRGYATGGFGSQNDE